jgi:hypothetical protein
MTPFPLRTALTLTLLGLCACQRDAKPAAQAPAPAAPAPAPAAAGRLAAGTVAETIDAAGYTYVRVTTASGEIWAAATQFKVKVGDKVIVPLDMPMENFHSSTLKRTFPVVYFTSRIFHESEPGAPTPNV